MKKKIIKKKITKKQNKKHGAHKKGKLLARFAASFLGLVALFR